MEKGMEGKGGGQLTNPKIDQVTVNSAKECQDKCLNKKECTAASYAVIDEAVKFCVFYAVGEERITDVKGSTHYRRNCPMGKY